VRDLLVHWYGRRRKASMSSHPSAVSQQAGRDARSARPQRDAHPAEPALPCVIGGSYPAPPAGDHPAVSRAWPRRDGVELSPVPAAVRHARLRSRQVLRDWGLGGLSADVELLVSELMTNAIAVAWSASVVRMWLLADTDRVLVLTWDPSPLPPVLANGGDYAEHGRGLRIVGALSEQWDWYKPQAMTGKVVWALAGGPRA
jgi:anti-sigma regulatory factor (Ser/Thr protein kinase)